MYIENKNDLESDWNMEINMNERTNFDKSENKREWKSCLQETHMMCYTSVGF